MSSPTPPVHRKPSGAEPEAPRAPAAERRPRRLSRHGHTRTDDYYWLRDDTRSDPEVLAHLEAENRHTDAVLAPVRGLRERLYHEIVGRIEPDDESVPLRRGRYWYLTRYHGAGEYPVYVRRRGAEDGPEETMLDVNELAAGHEYFQLGQLSVSDDDRLLAYAADAVGRRQYTIHFKDLGSGQTLTDELPETSGAMAWAADGATLFYVRLHPDTLLPYQVYRHRVGTPVAQDRLVYEEPDPAYLAVVYRGKSRRYVYLHLTSTLADEVRLLPADSPGEPFQVCCERERGHEYSVADSGDRFFVHSNWGAPNYRIFETTREAIGDRAAWREVVAHRDDTLIEEFDLFKDYLIVGERCNAVNRLRALPLAGGEAVLIAGEDPTGAVFLDDNDEIDSNVLRYGDCSLTRPYTIYDLDLERGERTLRKQTPVRGGYDPSRYRSERLTIEARDGAAIPVSLVCRHDVERDARQPLLVYAYGAYGISLDPMFSSARLSLLERGFVIALAHVRGGQELGRHWYDAGRLGNKMNSFTDFIDVTTGLIERRYADPDRVYAMGGSAGGLLIGAVINMAPALYHGAIALVPFVDIVTTMLDESIPLTTREFDEWGNPANREHYRNMLAYSPYDQVRAQVYPHLLVVTGLHDSQVQYWEPAKWVAKLRTLKTDSNHVLLHADLDAGHRGASGRFKVHRDTALEYAFLLWLAGLAETEA